MSDTVPHVVIIGGGFGGLSAARGLRNAPVKITLIDRTNHHLFQPLLYQVALAALSPADIAYPIRAILRDQRNAEVIMTEAKSIDAQQKIVKTTTGDLSYDYLVIAVGATNNYFGHDDWASNALGLKDLKDAIEVRRHVLEAFEDAETNSSVEARQALLTFLVIGGGATGVELAGSLAELARTSLQDDFRNIDPETARVILLEGGKRILPAFDPDLSDKALEQLKELGVEVRTEAMVTEITASGAVVSGEFIPARTVLWCAGVKANPLAASLGTAVDRPGRIIVNADLSVPNHPEIFAIGDVCSFSPQGGAPLPGVAPVAMQEGRAVAEAIKDTIAGRPRKEFRYVDKGSLATIGKSAAVADLHFTKLTKFPAWLAWLFIHIMFLIGFRNKLVVIFTWAWSYFTSQRGARLIVDYTAAQEDQIKKAGVTGELNVSALRKSLPPRE